MARSVMLLVTSLGGEETKRLVSARVKVGIERDARVIKLYQL